MKKINFGCGSDYKEGWFNIDIAGKNAKWQGINKPDKMIKQNKTRFPFLKNNSIDYILVDNVIEHIEPAKVEPLLLEFNRVLKPNGILDIYVPHFKGILTKFLEHKRGYGINSFWHYENYFYIKQNLFLLNRNKNAGFKQILFLNKLNFLFNFNITWQQICEKFLWFGFEEIQYIMRKKEVKK